MKKLILSLILLTFTNSLLASDNKLYVQVNGLVCDFCAQSLEKVFLREHGVTGVDVNLEDKLITIELQQDTNLEEEHIKKLVNDAGYTMVGLLDEASLKDE